MQGGSVPGSGALHHATETRSHMLPISAARPCGRDLQLMPGTLCLMHASAAAEQQASCQAHKLMPQVPVASSVIATRTLPRSPQPSPLQAWEPKGTAPQIGLLPAVTTCRGCHEWAQP